MAIEPSKMAYVVNIQFLKDNFQNKKIFITGHTGFKGSWLMACLHLAGAEIKGYSLEPDHPNSLFSLLDDVINCKSVIADIRNRQRLKDEIHSFQPDFIFHLAAQPLVRRSYEIPAETFDVNVTGTANLLEAAIELKKPCTIVVITTDKVYKNIEDHILYKENDILGGYDPYSASKACTELVVDSFRNSFFNPEVHNHHKKGLTSARAGNVIGGGDWNKDRIVPDIIRSLTEGKVIEIRNPSSIRPWQFVLEPIAGYLQLAVSLKSQPIQFNNAFNFGPYPNDHITVKEFVDIAIDTWGHGNWQDTSSYNQPHEAGLLQLDINKAINELEWNPKLNAAQAIEWTVNWYKKKPADQMKFTFHQVNEYFSI